MDIYSTHYLCGIVNSLITPPLFLLDHFFPYLLQAEDETIHFDVIDKTRRLAPFVSPMLAGKVIEEKGYSTLSFKPAYIKIKTALEPLSSMRRVQNEQVGQPDSLLQRHQHRLNAILLDQFDVIHRRLEWMAAKALLDAAYTVEGDEYQTAKIDFGRDSNHKINLPALRCWNNVGSNPLLDLNEWHQMILKKTGASAFDIVMTPDVFSIFKENPVIEARFKRVQAASQDNTLQTGSPAGEGGTFMGEIERFKIWVYTAWYLDQNGQEHPMLPPGTVILTSPELAGTRAFGAILDMEAASLGLAPGTPLAVPVFAKSWADDDPSLRWIMTQCAPLIVPTRVNASISARVLQ